MLKNMKIKTSLLMGFGITLLVSVILIGATLLMMNQQSDQLSDVIRTEVKACDLIKSSRLNANIAARNLRNILLLPDSKCTPRSKVPWRIWMQIWPSWARFIP